MEEREERRAHTQLGCSVLDGCVVCARVCVFFGCALSFSFFSTSSSSSSLCALPDDFSSTGV